MKRKIKVHANPVGSKRLRNRSKKSIRIENGTKYEIERVYQVPLGGMRKRVIRITEKNMETGEVRILYDKGTNIPEPDKLPGMPGGAKPPKPGKSKLNRKAKHKVSKAARIKNQLK